VKLIYDGDCGFCTKSANFGKKRTKKKVEYVTSQSIDDLSKYELTREEVSKRVYWVDNKRVVGGSRAIFRAMRQMKFPYSLLGAIMLFPGLWLLAEPIYNLIAKNRHKMPGSSEACKINYEEKE